MRQRLIAGSGAGTVSRGLGTAVNRESPKQTTAVLPPRITKPMPVEPSRTFEPSRPIVPTSTTTLQPVQPVQPAVPVGAGILVNVPYRPETVREVAKPIPTGTRPLVQSTSALPLLSDASALPLMALAGIVLLLFVIGRDD